MKQNILNQFNNGYNSIPENFKKSYVIAKFWGNENDYTTVELYSIDNFENAKLYIEDNIDDSLVCKKTYRYLIAVCFLPTKDLFDGIMEVFGDIGLSKNKSNLTLH